MLVGRVAAFGRAAVPDIPVPVVGWVAALVVALVPVRWLAQANGELAVHGAGNLIWLSRVLAALRPTARRLVSAFS